MLYVIRITQLAEEINILKTPKIVRQAVVVEVTRDSTGVLSLKSYILDHVIYKGVSIERWQEFKCSAKIYNINGLSVF